MTTYALFKQFCKETNRSGGVLLGPSIKEFCDWLDKKEAFITSLNVKQYTKEEVEETRRKAYKYLT